MTKPRTKVTQMSETQYECATTLQRPLSLKEPATFADAFTAVAQDMVKQSDPNMKAYGLYMKYMAEAISGYIADCDRHELNHEALFHGAINGVMNVLAGMLKGTPTKKRNKAIAISNIAPALGRNFAMTAAQNCGITQEELLEVAAETCDCEDCAEARDKGLDRVTGKKITRH